MSMYQEPVDWVEAAINSILSQSYDDFELIIVNDLVSRGENAILLEKIRSQDSRVQVLHNPKNIGLTASLNVALLHARGEYIARMDADDIAIPERFEIQLSFMESHPEIGVCGSNIRTFGSEEKQLSYPEHMDEIHLFFESPFAHPTVMIRRSCLDLVGGYDEHFRVSQDFDLWERLYEKGVKFYNIQQVLLNYRLSANQISHSKLQTQFRNAALIRYRALKFSLSTIDNSYELSDSLSFADVKRIPSLFDLDESASKRLYYYLFLSLKCSIPVLLCYIIAFLCSHSLPFSCLIRIVYYKLIGRYMVKYESGSN